MVKRVLIILLIVILVSQLLTACSNKTVPNEYEDRDYDVTINYELKYDKDIFGDLSREEIREILGVIMDEVLLDDDIEFVAKEKLDIVMNPYQVNADSIIESVLKEYGIDDTDKIDLAKSKMTIKKIKRN
ncbi:MAG: hypothetical protein K8R73_12920 [Clostridiales bacterium]|nr:hypothetical protein [Clostridiales bacterium]